jgi:hypothetical protein
MCRGRCAFPVSGRRIAIQEAQAGLELARVTLAGAVRRMERP